MTAKEAWQIAMDASQINAFRDRLNRDIERIAKEGLTYHIDYISWDVSQTAVETLAQEFKDKGFSVGYDEDIWCADENHYNRGFWLDWSKGGDSCK